MSVFNGNKTIDKTVLNCGDKATVNISFDSKSELSARPADVILVLDKSGSMTGERLTEAKKGAINLINIMSKASGNIDGTKIDNKSRIGIVGFDSTATPLAALTNDVKTLTDAVTAITAGGSTNHEDAFIKAKEMIDPASTNEKIIVMFTDGKSNVGGDVTIQTDLIKQDGTEIYCIALTNDRTEIDKWASTPLDQYVETTTLPAKIEELFNNIAYKIINVGAEDILINEKLNKDFKISRIISNNVGTATVTGLQTLEWQIAQFGISTDEKAELAFEIEYIGTENKTTKVNELITYTDKAKNTLTFPNPDIQLTCTEVVIIPDSCQTGTTVEIDSCNDAQTLVVNDIVVEDLGRVVQVDVPIKNVCPNKRLGLSVLLTEIDINGVEHNRGMKTVLINKIVSDTCEDIIVKCLNFSVPEALDPSGNIYTICNTRTFKARAFVNYIDTNFTCCDTNTVIVD